MRQQVTIQWYPIEFGEMPDDEGTFLVAWSDGTVESYPMDSHDIATGEIKSGTAKGIYWAESIQHPDR